MDGSDLPLVHTVTESLFLKVTLRLVFVSQLTEPVRCPLGVLEAHGLGSLRGVLASTRKKITSFHCPKDLKRTPISFLSPYPWTRCSKRLGTSSS